MKKRDIFILAGLGVLVVLVAWYFLVIGPKRDSIGEAQNSLKSEKDKYETNADKVKRLEQERDIADQTTADLLKLHKMVPVDSQVPSLIVELQRSARDSGIEFISIVPGVPVAGGDGTTIVPFELKFDGRFYDTNEFLYRIEDYARMEGSSVNVSGRFISVVALKMEESEDGEFPYITTTLNINAYMTSAPPATSAKKSTKTASGDEAAAQGGQ